MKKIAYIAIALIFLLSFCFYSSLFYPVLNSDNAISILMIHYFQLPQDLYFWGQDRMGSLIPLLGQFFFKIAGFSALTSEAVTHYLLLLLGFLAFSSFLRTSFYKIVFAIIWFFPPMRLIDVTQFSFGIHYSLIAIACYLFSQYEKEKIQQRIFIKHLLLLSITIVLIITIWVSDMALVSVFWLLAIQAFFYLKANKVSDAILKQPELYYALLGSVVGYLFIHYAKSISPIHQDYAMLGNADTIRKTVRLFFGSLSDFFAFKAKEPFTSVYAYLVMAIFLIAIYYVNQVQWTKKLRKWVMFFFLEALLLFIVIMISQWTFLNGVPRRYFTCTYISLAFGTLLLLDNLMVNKKHEVKIKAIVMLTVLIGGVGTFYNIKYIWPKMVMPRVELVSEFEKLGEAGIIAEYWNSYINSCTAPEKIIVTPHDQVQVRSQQLVEKVFQQKNLYIIKDMWMDTFPDSLTQFGRLLVKDGAAFRMGDCDVCKYKLSTRM